MFSWVGLGRNVHLGLGITGNKHSVRKEEEINFFLIFLVITLLIAAYLKLSVSLTHLNGGKETPLENLFVHLKVFTQVIHQVTHLLNQYHWL